MGGDIPHHKVAGGGSGRKSEVALEALEAASQLSDSIYSEQLMLALGHLTEFYDNVAPGDRHKQESGPASPVILWIALGAMAAFSAFAAWRWIKQKERSEEMLERLKALESGSNESKRADEENCNKRGSELSVLSMHLASLSKELNTIEKMPATRICREANSPKNKQIFKILKTQETHGECSKSTSREANQGFFDKLYGLSRTDQCRSQDVCVHPRRDDHKGDCDCNKQVGKDCGLHKI